MVWTYPLTHPDATRAVGGSDTEEMAEVEIGPGPIGSVQRSRSRSASRSRSPIIPLVRLELSTDSSESSDEGDSDYQPQLDNVRAPGRRRSRRFRRVPRQPRMHLQPEPQPEPMVQDPQPGPSRRQESPEVMRPDEIGWDPEEKLREVRVLRGPLTDELILVRNGRTGCRLCPFNASRDGKRWRNIYRHLSTHVEQNVMASFLSGYELQLYFNKRADWLRRRNIRDE